MKSQLNITKLIGSTPMIKIKHRSNNILIKLESYNIGGSIKDRAVLRIINDAEGSGSLKKGDTIIEATSGNTGIAAALIGRLKGYKVIIVTHDKISNEKLSIIKYYGAEVILVDSTIPAESEYNFINIAKKIARKNNHYFLNQFENESNVISHFDTTGPEIWEQTEGKIDSFICGIGSGGTITGVSRFLKNKNSQIKIIAADPEGSIYYPHFYGSNKSKTSSIIEGIGSNFIPKILDLTLIDHITQVSDKEAISACYFANEHYGLSIGISSGAAFHTAIQYSKTKENINIVIISPDSSERYLSKIANYCGNTSGACV